MAGTLTLTPLPGLGVFGVCLGPKLATGISQSLWTAKFTSILHPLDAFPDASYLKQMQSCLGLQKVFVTITTFCESHQ
jgi:hypothetical protein